METLTIITGKLGVGKTHYANALLARGGFHDTRILDVSPTKEGIALAIREFEKGVRISAERGVRLVTFSKHLILTMTEVSEKTMVGLLTPALRKQFTGDIIILTIKRA
jgi:hypothetical protein